MPLELVPCRTKQNEGTSKGCLAVRWLQECRHRNGSEPIPRPSQPMLSLSAGRRDGLFLFHNGSPRKAGRLHIFVWLADGTDADRNPPLRATQPPSNQHAIPNLGGWPMAAALSVVADAAPRIGDACSAATPRLHHETTRAAHEDDMARPGALSSRGAESSHGAASPAERLGSALRRRRARRHRRPP